MSVTERRPAGLAGRDRDGALVAVARGEISVTEVRNALRCPRIFALGRRDGGAVAFPVGSSTLGATFHRVANDFVAGLDTPPAYVAALGAEADGPTVVGAVVRWLLDEHLVPALHRHPELATMPAEVDDLAEALRELARHLAGIVAASGRSPAAALGAQVRYAETQLSTVIDAAPPVAGAAPDDPPEAATLAGCSPVRLVGRPDAVYVAPSGRLEVVEYKLTDEANEALDEAQVSLYRYLLRHALGLDAEPVILRFDPALSVTRLGADAADELTARVLLPLVGRMVGWAHTPAQAPATERADLCACCPVQLACAATYGDGLPSRDTPPAGGVRLRPDPSGRVSLCAGPDLAASGSRDEAGEAEARALGDLILSELRRQAVHAHATDVVAGPSLLRVQVSSSRQRVRQLDQAAEDVCHQLESLHQLAVEFRKEGARRAFYAPRRQCRPVELGPLLARRAAWLREQSGRFVLGEDLYGNVVHADLSDAATCHLLVGGQTGSGKSVLLRALVRGLAHFHPPAAIRFTLIDPKRVTFGALRAQLGAHLDGPILFDVEQVLPRLGEFVAEMNERYARFEQAGVEDIASYNEDRPGAPLARHVIVVDEFQDLSVGRQTREPFVACVQSLGAKARAAGIHLVLATQRPDAKTVPGEIKTNLVGKVALRVQSAVDSRIILDEGGAESLLGRGDLLANLGHGIVRAQAPLG